MHLINDFSFELPTKIEYGVGAYKKLTEALADLKARRIVVVSDKGIVKSGLLDGIQNQLSQKGRDYRIFDGVEANPKDYNVQEGARMAVDHKADCLVAVGGGSPIDCAKAIAVAATHKGSIRDFEGSGKITHQPIPLIAIPTTAGSGSEVTFSAVITDSRDKFKFSIRDTKNAPRAALADPEMTRTMPAELTAATGMDALTHAIEAFSCRVSNPLTDAAALYAVELIARHLKTAVFDGQNLEARSGMLLGSILAAIAFSHSDVAAVHCIAEALGGKFDTPHGVCNAVALPAVMEYNMSYCMEKYARIATAMGLAYEDTAAGAKQAVEAVKKLVVELNLPDFNSFGVREKDFAELAQNSVNNGSNIDNPRPMAAEDYLNVLKTLSSNR
ncbi:MAG: iron-containing alcohol dehydrogenase [Desulfobacterales bacterium]|jgi:alcohol dehydrogenase